MAFVKQETPPFEELQSEADKENQSWALQTLSSHDDLKPVLNLDSWPAVAKFILCTRSQVQKELFSQLVRRDFSVIERFYEESHFAIRGANNVVELRCYDKAQDVWNNVNLKPLPLMLGKTLLICSETLIRHKGRAIKRPKYPEDVPNFLRRYCTGNDNVSILNSIIVVDVHGRQSWQGLDESRVHFKRMSEERAEEIAKVYDICSFPGGLNFEITMLAECIDFVEGSVSTMYGLSLPLLRLVLNGIADGAPGKPFPQ